MSRFHVKFTNATDHSIEDWLSEEQLKEEYPQVLKAVREDKSCVGGVIDHKNNCRTVITDLSKIPVVEE